MLSKQSIDSFFADENIAIFVANILNKLSTAFKEQNKKKLNNENKC